MVKLLILTLLENKKMNKNTSTKPVSTLTTKTDILLALYIGAIIAAELLGSKIFSVGPLNASVAIFVFPLTYTINDIIYEVHGKKRAQGFMRAGFIVLVLLFIFTLLAISLPPATRFADANPAYQATFAKSLRIILASLAAFWASEQFDIYVFSRLRERLGQKRLWFRNNASNWLSQLLDTTVFMFLAFYSGSVGFIVSLIIPYWLLKCVFSAAHTPFTYFGIKWLKSKGE